MSTLPKSKTRTWTDDGRLFLTFEDGEGVDVALINALVAKNYPAKQPSIVTRFTGETTITVSLVAGSSVSHKPMNVAAYQGRAVARGTVAVLMSAAVTKPQPVKTTPVTAVEVTLRGAAWTASFAQGQDIRTKAGVVSGGSGQEQYLLAARDALSGIKPGNWTVRVSIPDTNVRRMLAGEMQSRKHTELLEQVRELSAALKVVIVE